MKLNHQLYPFKIATSKWKNNQMAENVGIFSLSSVSNDMNFSLVERHLRVGCSNAYICVNNVAATAFKEKRLCETGWQWIRELSNIRYHSIRLKSVWNDKWALRVGWKNVIGEDRSLFLLLLFLHLRYVQLDSIRFNWCELMYYQPKLDCYWSSTIDNHFLIICLHWKRN